MSIPDEDYILKTKLYKRVSRLIRTHHARTVEGGIYPTFLILLRHWFLVQISHTIYMSMPI